MTAATPPQAVIDRAVAEATRSPCRKSARGVVIYAPTAKSPADGPPPWSPQGAVVFGRGTNGPPAPFVCDGTDLCRAACRRLCVHAEARAILEAVSRRTGGQKRDRPLAGFDALHVKVVDGMLVAGGGPSCVQCSVLVLETGLDGFWLYEEMDATGRGVWMRYTAEQFHAASLSAHELPIIRGSR